MRHLPYLALALFTLGILAMVTKSSATELHTFDFSGGDLQIMDNLDGVSSGSYTSVGATDAITLNIATSLGVLDFTSASGNLGIDDSTSIPNAAQTISLKFTSLYNFPVRIRSITMTSVMEVGSPLAWTRSFVLDPNDTYHSLYRYDNSQLVLLGIHNVPDVDEAELHVNNLQHGYHSLHSVTIASESSGGPGVPEPTTALLLLAGTCPLALVCFRKNSRARP